MIYRKMKSQERRACVEMAAKAFADYEYFSVYVPNGKKRAAVAQLVPPRAPAPTPGQYLKAGFWKAMLWGGYKNLLDWYEMGCQAEKPCLEKPGFSACSLWSRGWKAGTSATKCCGSV